MSAVGIVKGKQEISTWPVMVQFVSHQHLSSDGSICFTFSQQFLFLASCSWRDDEWNGPALVVGVLALLLWKSHMGGYCNYEVHACTPSTALLFHQLLVCVLEVKRTSSCSRSPSDPWSTFRGKFKFKWLMHHFHTYLLYMNLFI